MHYFPKMPVAVAGTQLFVSLPLFWSRRNTATILNLDWDSDFLVLADQAAGEVWAMMGLFPAAILPS